MVQVIRCHEMEPFREKVEIYIGEGKLLLVINCSILLYPFKRYRPQALTGVILMYNK